MRVDVARTGPAQIGRLVTVGEVAQRGGNLDAASNQEWEDDQPPLP